MDELLVFWEVGETNYMLTELWFFVKKWSHSLSLKKSKLLKLCFWSVKKNLLKNMKVRLINKSFQEIHRIINDIDDLLTVSLSTQSVLELPYQGLRLPLCYQSWSNDYGPELCSSLGLGSVKQLLPHLNSCLTLCPPKFLKNCGGCS